jgi:hypothetical protein
MAYQKINENNIEFINFGELSNYFRAGFQNVATYSGTSNSALFGLTKKG